MIHIVFLLTVGSLCTGTVAITIAVLFNLRYHKKEIFWFTLLLAMVQLLSLARAIELYGTVAATDAGRIFNLVALILEKTGYTLGLIAGPRFCFRLLGLPMSKTTGYVISGVAALYVATAIAELLFFRSQTDPRFRLATGIPLLFGMYIYLLGRTAFSFEQLASGFLRAIVKVTFLLSLAVLPLSLLKYFRNAPYLPWHFENTLVLFALMTGSILFASRYFTVPPYMREGNISPFFRKKFGTTKREEEIIVSVVSGLSNSDIADRLFISVRTVESHLYNIFQKTGVKNRVQLINLFKTNQSD
jgi:DNA-binding CsgD family transcriptional regulator